MKAEILRLAEAMVADSDEESGGRALDVMDLDDDLDEAGTTTIKVLGDGEDSGDEEGDEERGVDPIKPETVLELAYIRDPKLFDRDAQTRKSKSRADLKQQTGNITVFSLIWSYKKFICQVGQMNRLRVGESCWKET